MCGYIELSSSELEKLLPERKLDSNKGTYGKVLNIAGSFNYQGAAYLSSVSALKTGASGCITGIAVVCCLIFYLPSPVRHKRLKLRLLPKNAD